MARARVGDDESRCVGWFEAGDIVKIETNGMMVLLKKRAQTCSNMEWLVLVRGASSWRWCYRPTFQHPPFPAGTCTTGGSGPARLDKHG